MRRVESRLLRLALLGVALFTIAGIAGAETAQPPALRLNAIAVNLSGIGPMRSEMLEIAIDRWSSDAEHDKLLGVLESQGSDRLLDALQEVKPRAGYIRTTTSLGWDIQYAKEDPLPDGGRRIVFATNRPMSFFELRNGTRSSEYEFMVCEITLDKEGMGEGKLAVLAKVAYDKAKKQIEIENYGIEPVRLTRVTIEK